MVSEQVGKQVDDKGKKMANRRAADEEGGEPCVQLICVCLEEKERQAGSGQLWVGRDGETM